MFATGVTVVTCTDEAGQACGVTANSFSSVSLEPPLVLWNIAKVTRSLSAYLGAEHFAINVLSAEQKDISKHFAKSETNIFADVEHRVNDDKVPLIPNALAHLECRTDQVHDCGDHHIIVGEVISYRKTDGAPLLFFGGGYQNIA